MVLRCGQVLTHWRAAHSRSLAPTVKQLLSQPPAFGAQTTVRGHIKSVRTFKEVGFVDISDGTSQQNIAVVVRGPDAVANLGVKVGQGVEVVAEVAESKGTQAFELVYQPEQENHSIKIIGDVPVSYPIQKQALTYQYLRNYPTLRHRTSSLASVLRLRSMVEGAFMEFFNANDCTKVTPPMLTTSDCEGAGEQFRVTVPGPVDKKAPEFFGKPTYLTVSTQLHLEVLALSLSRVWTLTPCFRAEDSHTNRHLAEFWMLEAELCHLDSLKQLTDFTEDMIRSVTAKLQQNSEDVLGSRFSKADKKAMTERWAKILSDQRWPSITYEKALELINKHTKSSVQWGDSISTEHEKWLSGTHFKSPVFVTNYPKHTKPFYMPMGEGSRPTAACFDLLFPEIGELIGGSLREHDHATLVQEMEARNMNLEEMEWYLSTRVNGSVSHGGFGMGFERLLSYLAAIDNVKEIAAFPRTAGSCAC